MSGDIEEVTRKPADYLKIVILDYTSKPDFPPISAHPIENTGLSWADFLALEWDKEARKLKHTLPIYDPPHKYSFLCKIEKGKLIVLPTYTFVTSFFLL